MVCGRNCCALVVYQSDVRRGFESTPRNTLTCSWKALCSDLKRLWILIIDKMIWFSGRTTMYKIRFHLGDSVSLYKALWQSISYPIMVLLCLENFDSIEMYLLNGSGYNFSFQKQVKMSKNAWPIFNDYNWVLRFQFV